MTVIRTHWSKRFWNHVDKGDPDECWEWKGATHPFGYGMLWEDSVSNLTLGAHTFSWRLHNKKPIPKGMYVCHSRDNPPCVNPNHLFLGTQKDNRQDCANKGRTAKGETHGMAKLTNEEVLSIRRLYIPRLFSTRILASMYRISQRNVMRILHGLNWKHV